VSRWSLYVDIEGFSVTYATDTQPLVSLGALMTAIYEIGSRVYRESPDRLFAHQLGDGFIVVGEFGWPALEQPCSVAIALMRAVLLSGGVAKAAIAEGELADVVGCYPETIRQLHGRALGGAFPLGGGLMTVLPVMGTALINAYKLLEHPRTRSGALLVVPRDDVPRLPDGVRCAVDGDTGYVDWVHAEYEHLDTLENGAGLRRQNPARMTELLERYIASHHLSDGWIENTRRYLGITA
jgi:hypothetical protein